MNQLIENVLEWGEAKQITGPHGKGTLLGQLTKTQEELTETRDAAIALTNHHMHLGKYADKLTSESRMELKDGIGDCVVTLILAAEMAGFTLEECLSHAYEIISKRTGVMRYGIFVKDK